MPINFLAQILIGIAIAVISYALMPKPKIAKPDSVEELDYPTAEAGKPVTVMFGTNYIESPNVLWYGERRSEKRSL